jgi:hypothetical protein
MSDDADTDDVDDPNDPFDILEQWFGFDDEMIEAFTGVPYVDGELSVPPSLNLDKRFATDSDMRPVTSQRRAVSPTFSKEFFTDQFLMEPEVAEKTVQRIFEQIEAAERQYGEIDQLIVGVPQYKALRLYTNNDRANYRGTRTPEDEFPGIELIVVPGPMIHPVIDNHRLLANELRVENEE